MKKNRTLKQVFSKYDNHHNLGITKGSKYDVLAQSSNDYCIINDYGELTTLNRTNFKDGVSFVIDCETGTKDRLLIQKEFSLKSLKIESNSSVRRSRAYFIVETKEELEKISEFSKGFRVEIYKGE